jgi:Tfp pilus assembly protein PilX
MEPMDSISVSNILHKEEGFALLLALFVVAVVLIMGITVMTVSMMNMESSSSMSVGQQNFQIADAGTSIGRDFLLAQASPPESDPTTVSNPPMSDYTAWSSDLNPVDSSTANPFPFPQYRYLVQPAGSPSVVSEGQDYEVYPLSGSTAYWHYYKVTSESRSGRSAAANLVDRSVVTVVRLVFFH